MELQSLRNGEPILKGATNEGYTRDSVKDREFVFGEIEFEDAHATSVQDKPKPTSKYVKIDINCDVNHLIEAVKKEWNLDHPNLLISVMGGAWDFPVNDSVREVFRKGIIQTTIGTKAWILTSGLNVGVSKYVAKAIKGSRQVSKYLRKKPTAVVTIGIISFSNIRSDHRVKLKTASKRVTLSSTEIDNDGLDMKGRRTLDADHSHFILVDDTDEYSGSPPPLHVIRENLENVMSTYMAAASEKDLDDVIEQIKPGDLKSFLNGLGLHLDTVGNVATNALEVLRTWKHEKGCKATRKALLTALKRLKVRYPAKEMEEKWKDGPVPVVCLYIEGGHKTIDHACRVVENGIPIVVVDHSGRAANLLALAFKSDGLKWETEKLESRLRKITPDDILPKLLHQIQTALDTYQKRCLWNVYGGDSKLEIDQVMLQALMQANREDSQRQLDLAQTWNRHDIVRRELFVTMRETIEWEDYNAEKAYFQEKLHTALVNKKHGFVKLYLENGVVPLETFLTREELTNLYNEVKKSPLKKLLQKRSQMCLSCIRNSTTSQPGISEQETFELEDVGEMIRELSLNNINPYKEVRTCRNSDETLEDPFRHLFLFAVLNNFQEMAEYFWEEGRDNMAAALVATEIYEGMAERFKGDKKTIFRERARRYEELACKILDECEKGEKDFRRYDISNLLFRETPKHWGGSTCLKLAEATESRKFIAHHSVQTLVNYIWRHGLPEEKNPISEKKEPTKRNLMQRVFRSSRSPRSKFTHNVISYLLFLALFSYILLSNQVSSPYPTWWEWLLIVWVGTIFIEEIRQVAHDLLNRKWEEYISSYWNKIDLVMLSGFVVAIILRFVHATREAGRILLACDLFIFYFRLLYVLTIAKALGPKVIMIFKMFVDLMLFLGILFIILLGYGVAVQAILYPQVDNVASVIQGIVYRPYFQIYGELFLEDITATASDGSCTSNQTAIDLGAVPCPQHSVIGVLFLALYMMLSNVLLLNLLIAMFSDTFSKVQEETDLHWKFHSYTLTKEYFQRPALMPPFIIITDTYRFIVWTMRKLGCFWFAWTPSKIQRKFSPSEEERLVKLEKLAAYNYIVQKRRFNHKAVCPCCQSTQMSKRRIFDRLKEFEEEKKNVLTNSGSNELMGFNRWSDQTEVIELFTTDDKGFGFGLIEFKILFASQQKIKTVNVVGSLVSGGVAEEDGRLASNDKIVSVNDMNIEECSREFVTQVLKNLGNRVKIEVAKPLLTGGDEIFI